VSSCFTKPIYPLPGFLLSAAPTMCHGHFSQLIPFPLPTLSLRRAWPLFTSANSPPFGRNLLFQGVSLAVSQELLYAVPFSFAPFPSRSGPPQNPGQFPSVNPRTRVPRSPMTLFIDFISPLFLTISPFLQVTGICRHYSAFTSSPLLVSGWSWLRFFNYPSSLLSLARPFAWSRKDVPIG